MTDAIGTRNVRYDAATGTPDSVSDPTDSWVRYAFDSKGRLHGPYLTASTGYAFSRTQFYRTNGGLFELSNDQHYTVGELWQTSAEVADTLVQLWTEQRGLNGPQVTMRDSVTYDGWERVTALVHLTDGQVTASDTFAFDERGNLTLSGNGATFNTEDQLTSSSACASWTYDAAGNLTGKQCAGKWWVYTYDALDRLTGVTFDGAFVAAYTYDVLGNRIAKRTPTDTTRFVWRGGHVLYETSAAGTVRYSYQWGVGTDDLLAIHDHGSGAHYYVVQDKLHSVRGLVHRDGTWKAAWRYRGYGVVLDSAVAGSVAGLHRFGWAGAQYDAETGFYFLRTRYYDPTAGRFVQEDKIGRAGGLNLYAYAGGRPLAARDPGGTYASEEAIHFHFYWERIQITSSCISWCDPLIDWYNEIWFAQRYDARTLTSAEIKALGTLCNVVDCTRVLVVPQGIGSIPFTPGAIGSPSGYLTVAIPGADGVFAREVNGVLEVAEGMGLLAHEMYHAARSQNRLGFDSGAVLANVGDFLSAMARFVATGRWNMPDRYAYAIAPGLSRWEMYTPEQRGSIVQDCHGGSSALACGIMPFQPGYDPAIVKRGVFVFPFPK
jgi:RHS repeat-associated protein